MYFKVYLFTLVCGQNMHTYRHMVLVQTYFSKHAGMHPQLTLNLMPKLDTYNGW